MPRTALSHPACQDLPVTDAMISLVDTDAMISLVDTDAMISLVDVSVCCIAAPQVCHVRSRAASINGDSLHRLAADPPTAANPRS